MRERIQPSHQRNLYELKTQERIVHKLIEDYKNRRLAGENPSLQEYLKAYPEKVEEIKADIEAWEWLQNVKGTWKYLASLPPIDVRLQALQPHLDKIDKERKKKV